MGSINDSIVSEEEINSIFCSDFLKLDRAMIKIFDLNTSIFLCELASEYLYWLKRDKIDDDGYFFSTVENVEFYTSLTKYKQLEACKVLMEYGIIQKKTLGLPAKRYFRFNKDAFYKLKSDIVKVNEEKKKHCLDILNKNQESIIVCDDNVVKKDFTFSF